MCIALSSGTHVRSRGKGGDFPMFESCKPTVDVYDDVRVRRGHAGQETVTAYLYHDIGASQMDPNKVRSGDIRIGCHSTFYGYFLPFKKSGVSLTEKLHFLRDCVDVVVIERLHFCTRSVLRWICEIVTQSTRLVRIELSHVKFRELAMFRELLEVVGKRGVRELVVCYVHVYENSVRVGHLASVADVLARHGGIRKIYVAEEGCTREDMVEFCTVTRSGSAARDSPFERVSFALGRVADPDVARAFVDMTTKLRTESLVFYYTSFPLGTFARMFSSIVSDPSCCDLKHLEIQHGKVTNMDILGLVQLIQNAPHLEHVSLLGNERVSSKYFTALNNAIYMNNALRTVYFAGTRITRVDEDRMLAISFMHPSLTHYTFFDNDIEWDEDRDETNDRLRAFQCRMDEVLRVKRTSV